MLQTKWGRCLTNRFRIIRSPHITLKQRVVVCSSVVLFAICQSVWGQQDKYRHEAIYVGNTVYNVCETLPVFSRPEITVGPIGSPNHYLSFGETIVVASREKKYEVPNSHPMSKLRLCRAKTGGSSRGSDEGGCDPNPNSYQRYEWFGISGGGYVPANCLVHEKWFARQKEKRVASDAVTLQGAAGKKKKSQNVTQNCAAAADGVVTLQGAAGKKKKSQGQSCSRSLDDYLKALPQLTIFSNEMESFMKEGQLGNFGS